MSENLLQIIASLKLVAVAVFATLYGFGGIRGKWKRRILGSCVYTLLLCALSLWSGSFSLWYLSVFPILFGGLSIGYGADDFKDKVIKRSRYGFFCSLAALPVAIVNQAWLMLVLHIFLCVLVSVVLGVFNPTKNARNEETLIGATIGLLPLYMF